MDTLEIKPTSVNGFNYVIYLQDEATSFGWVLFAKREDTAEVAVEVINFIKLLELQTGITLQIIHTDGGTEFAPKKLKAK